MWNLGRIFQVTVAEKNKHFFPHWRAVILQNSCADEFSGTPHAGKITFGATIGLELPFFKQAHQIGIVEHQWLLIFRKPAPQLNLPFFFLI